MAVAQILREKNILLQLDASSCQSPLALMVTLLTKHYEEKCDQYCALNHEIIINGSDLLVQRHGKRHT